MTVKAAVVEGVRTPFVKAGTKFKNISMQKLGAHTLSALVKRSELDPIQIDKISFGAVLLDARTPNWAREILFEAGLPEEVYAQSVSNNCISGLVSVVDCVQSINLGKSQICIAGGAESMSLPPILFRERAAKLFSNLTWALSLIHI